MAQLVDPHVLATTDSITKKVYRDLYPLVDPSVPALSQHGKVVLITGASRGLGKIAFASSFARAGPKAIIITARKVDDLESTEQLIKSIDPNIEVFSAALEITDEAAVEALFEQVRAKFGTVDVLVNNAGLFKSARHPIKDGDLGLLWKDVETNSKGQLLVARQFLRLLGPEKKGTYIGVSSRGAFMVVPGNSGYALGKLVNVQLAAYIAAENANVTAFGYNPGAVLTDMHDDVGGDFKHLALDTAELSGGFAVWLATEAATFLNGRYVSMNWAVDELIAMKEDIISSDALKVRIGGNLSTAVLAGLGSVETRRHREVELGE